MSSVNSQIVSAARNTNRLAIAPSADLSMANTFMAAAQAIGLIMYNAAQAEQGSQQVAQAAVATTCAMIVKNGAA